MAKKFKDTKIGKFLSANGSGIVNSLGDVLPDNGVFGLVKNLIDKDDKMPVEDKEKAMKLLEMEMTEMQEISNRWSSDMSASGTFLSKNVRPITLMFFSVSYVIGWYLGYELDSITGLLSLIVGSYFGSRGIEKIMGNNKHK
jgi:hypothetical protein